MMRLKATMLAIGLAVSSVAVAQDMDLFAMADSNHDDKVTPAEYAAFREMGWDYFFAGQDSTATGANPAASTLLAGVAVDAAGRITHSAFTAAAPVAAKQADKNGDGTLNRAEFEAAMPPPG
jgi:hypothetical protein